LTPYFDVQVDLTVSEVTLVSVWGEVDAASSVMLFEVLAWALSLDNTGSVEVDLAAVTLLDASGIGVLLAAQCRAVTLGKKFRVGTVAGLPLEVLEVTGVLGRLHGKTTEPGRAVRGPRSPRRRHDR
jgi:anti-anti-sigma factor